MRVLAVLGPSASGKSTAVRALSSAEVIEVTPSWTTRPRRLDEAEDTVEHRFVDDEQFDELERSSFFLEVVRMFDLPYRYGLPVVKEPASGRVPAIMVRAPLMPLVRRHFPHHLAYQVEDDYQRVRARLQRRRLGPSEMGTRLERFEEERLAGREAAARVFVNNGSTADLVDAMTRAIAEDFGVVPLEEPCPRRA